MIYCSTYPTLIMHALSVLDLIFMMILFHEVLNLLHEVFSL